MKSELKNILKVAGIYTASVIGAGFASGQEIVQFFSSYYKGGFLGIILMGILFSVVGLVVLDRVYSQRIRNYDEFLFPMVGWTIGWIVQILVTLFMTSVFCVMIAGAGRIIADSTGIPFNYAVVIMSIVCMLVMLTDIKGLVSVSSVLTPVLIVGILLVGFYIIVSKDTSVFSIGGFADKATDNWLFSSLVYVSYNSILSVVVLTSLLPYLKTKRTGRIGGVLGGMVLCFIALVINFVIYIFYPDPIPGELPILGLISRYSSGLSIVYTFILWLAMFISAITSGYCIVDRVSSKVGISKKLIAAMICALAVPLSSIGFSRLISTVYPVFGYMGLFLLVIILLQGINRNPLAFSRRKNK